MFKIKRYKPTKIEVDITTKQLVGMFPIEVQEHSHMGIIERVWKVGNEIYSVKTIPEQFVTDLSKNKLHKLVNEEKMLNILSKIEHFEIILYYEGKEDRYEVHKIDHSA